MSSRHLNASSAYQTGWRVLRKASAAANRADISRKNRAFGTGQSTGSIGARASRLEKPAAGVSSWSKAAYFFCAVTASVFALPARSETVDVSDNHGGSVAQYSGHWAELARQGVSVRIVGPCQSACTVLLGHIPRSRICVTPGASFGFHLAHLAQATATLRSAYSSDITAWINAHGGLTQEFIWMRAPDTYRYFRKC
jgi:hypothetical protein